MGCFVEEIGIGLLEYVYCGEVEVDEESVLELYEMSDKWCMKDLQEECERFLVKNMKVENWEKIAEKIEKIGGITRRLENAVMRFKGKKLDVGKEK